MTEEENRIEADAIIFAKTHKKAIAKKLTNTTHFLPDKYPVSIFMSGSPGAGKTESSFRLIEKLTGRCDGVLRIDSDELRKEFSDYTGKNSYLFQGATSIISEKMQDFALKQSQSYVFDGTLSNLYKTRENIKRNLRRSRTVQILYVYQDPLQAWKHVLSRELKDGRMVPIESFIKQYFSAHENVNRIKKEFGNEIQVDLIVKNIDGSDFRYKENIDIIDNYVAERYSENILRAALKEI